MVTLLSAAAALLGLVIFAILLYFFVIPIRRPHLTHSDLSEKGLLWRLYYAHKYVHPIKLPPRNSDLPRYFRDLDFSFDNTPLEGSRTIRVNAVGDLMTRPDLRGSGSHLWEQIGPRLFSADLSIGNLEFAVNPARLIHKTIRYSVAPDQAVPLLGDSRFGRFALLCTANNHLNDSLSQGIISTCDYLDSVGIRRVGANRTAAEQDSIPVFEFDGARIAVLSYTFSTNGIPLQQGFSHGVNLVKFNALDDRAYDPALIHRHIERARRLGAHYIISCHHWDVEFEYYPQDRIMARGRALLDAGVDLILGHHPHVVKPVDHYRTRDGRDGIIFYSLGNVTTYALKRRETRMGVMAEITLESGMRGGRRIVRPKSVATMPFVYCRHRTGGAWRHCLVPVRSTADALLRGAPVPSLRARDRRDILFAHREFDRYFTQRGVAWI